MLNINKKISYILILYDYKKLSIKIEKYLIDRFLKMTRNLKVIYYKKAKV